MVLSGIIKLTGIALLHACGLCILCAPCFGQNSTDAFDVETGSIHPCLDAKKLPVAGCTPLANGPIRITRNALLRSDSAPGEARDHQAQDPLTTLQNDAKTYLDGRQYANVQAALTACPSSGCVIDMRENASASALNLGSFDPGSKAVTLLLGPYTYSVSTITLEKSLNITGNGTVLQSASTTNSPVFVLPQTNGTPASHVTLKNFQMLGASGNTSQDAFDLDCSQTMGDGLFYSLVQGITIQRFNGVAIRLRGPNSHFGSNTQFTTFQNIFVFRGPSATSGEALRLEGANSNLTFTECEFDGGITKNGTNIYLGVLKGGTDGYPESIHFHGITSQDADIAVAINGSVNIAFHGSHHEHIKTGAYLITSGTFNFGILIDSSYFAADGSYKRLGNGYLVNSASGSFRNHIIFTNNIFGQFGNAPDHVLLGEAQWTACGNFGPSIAFLPCQYTGQSMQAQSFQANQGVVQTKANISPGAGWGTGATITDVKGWTQTEQFTINSGSSSFSASPTISITFPTAFSEAPLCDLLVQDVKGSGGSILFNPTFSSGRMAQFTAETSGGLPFVPAAAENYKVLLRCGP